MLDSGRTGVEVGLRSPFPVSAACEQGGSSWVGVGQKERVGIVVKNRGSVDLLKAVHFPGGFSVLHTAENTVRKQNALWNVQSRDLEVGGKE